MTEGERMPETKLTESADERKFRAFLKKDCVYEIPLFQRPYRWMPAKVKQLHQDLDGLLEADEDELHFMGAIIIHKIDENFADLDRFEVIDGQQRITTVFLHIAAAALVLSRQADGAEPAWQILVTNVLNAESLPRAPRTFKLQPSRDDRKPLNEVIKRLMTSPGIAGLAAQNGVTVKYLTATSPKPSKRITTNFEAAVKFFKQHLDDGGVDRVLELVNIIRDRLSVVVIEVKDPLSGPKIFDSLNSGQEPMTVGDLVRNDIFARGNDGNAPIEDFNDQFWAPFLSGFQDGENSHFEDYFFPYGLLRDDNVKKSEVYQKMRGSWVREELTAAQVMSQLSEYQADYMLLRTGRAASGHSESVTQAFRRLHKLGSLTAAFPFLMRLSWEVRLNQFDEGECIRILDVIDSFLTRRALVGQEPTGLHALFKKLWKASSENGPATASSVRERIIASPTVQWPNDAQVRAAVESRPLYKAKVTRYVILELNQLAGGDVPDGSEMWIEHVLPQNPGTGWDAFSQTERDEQQDLLANLLPLSQEMNQELGRASYLVKHPKYKNDSIFKMTREFADSYTEWTPEALKLRSESLVASCLQRWPHGPGA